MVSCNLDSQILYSFMHCVGRVCKEGNICNYAAREWVWGASEEREMQSPVFHLRSCGCTWLPTFPFLETSRLLQRPEWRGTAAGASKPWCPGSQSSQVATGSGAGGGQAATALQEAGQMVFSGNCLRRPCRFLHSVSPILTSAHSTSSVRADSRVPKTDTGRILGASVCKIGKESTWSRSPDLDTQGITFFCSVVLLLLDSFGFCMSETVFIIYLCFQKIFSQDMVF